MRTFARKCVLALGRINCDGLPFDRIIIVIRVDSVLFCVTAIQFSRGWESAVGDELVSPCYAVSALIFSLWWVCAVHFVAAASISSGLRLLVLAKAWTFDSRLLVYFFPPSLPPAPCSALREHSSQRGLCFKGRLLDSSPNRYIRSPFFFFFFEREKRCVREGERLCESLLFFKPAAMQDGSGSEWVEGVLENRFKSMPTMMLMASPELGGWMQAQSALFLFFSFWSMGSNL